MQSGRRENLLTKWIYFLLKRVPQTLDAGTARTSRRRLRHPTVPPPMPGNRRAADRLLTLSTPVEFPIQTAPALLLFHGAVFFSVSRMTRSRGDQFLRAYARQKSSWLRCPVFAAPVAAGLQKADRGPCSASAASAAGSASASQSLVSPFWTKFSTEPRTRPHGLAHSLR